MRMIPKALLLLAVSSPAVLTGCRKAHHLVKQVTQNQPDDTPQIQAAITAGHIDGLKYPDFTPLQADVSNFYNGQDFDLAWSKGGKPTSQATAMMEQFSNAAKRGLRPEDYDASSWGSRVSNLQTPEGAAQFDVAMTVTCMRFLNDLHMGRTIPTHFAFGVKGYDSKKLDLSTVLKSQIVDASDIPSAIDSLEPQNEQYKALKTALAHYQELAAADHVEPLPELPGNAKPVALTPAYPGLQALQQRLAQTGDYTGDASAAPDMSALTEALKKFQERHGLTVGGRLSPDTVEALNTPMSTRVSQIEDSMERWRWMDDTYANASVVVNLPEFQLRAYEGTGGDRHEVFRMNVVDGKSDDDTHHTPMIADMMKYVVFPAFLERAALHCQKGDRAAHRKEQRLPVRQELRDCRSKRQACCR